MTERLSFGPVRTSAPTPRRTSPLRLTDRGITFTVALVITAIVGLPWLAAAIGYWATGVKG